MYQAETIQLLLLAGVMACAERCKDGIFAYKPQTRSAISALAQARLCRACCHFHAVDPLGDQKCAMNQTRVYPLQDYYEGLLFTYAFWVSQRYGVFLRKIKSLTSPLLARYAETH